MSSYLEKSKINKLLVVAVIAAIGYSGCSSDKKNNDSQSQSSPPVTPKVFPQEILNKLLKEKLAKSNKEITNHCKGKIIYREVADFKMAICYVKLPEYAGKVISILNKRPQQKWFISECGNKPGEEYCVDNSGTDFKETKDSPWYIPSTGTNGESKDGHSISFEMEDEPFEQHIDLHINLVDPELISGILKTANRSDQDAVNMLVNLVSIFDSSNAKTIVRDFIIEHIQKRDCWHMPSRVPVRSGGISIFEGCTGIDLDIRGEPVILQRILHCNMRCIEDWEEVDPPKYIPQLQE